MASHAPRVRSLYRRILRELPFRQSSETLLSHPTPLQRHIRSNITDGVPEKPLDTQLAEMEQFVHYAKAQRMYTTLLERYNPGMNMLDEERVRLSARRVGMNLPTEVQRGNKQ